MESLTDKQKKLHKIERILRPRPENPVLIFLAISSLVMVAYQLSNSLLIGLLGLMVFTPLVIFLFRKRKSNDELLNMLLTEYKPVDAEEFKKFCDLTKEKNALFWSDLREWVDIEKSALSTAVSKSKNNPHISFTNRSATDK